MCNCSILSPVWRDVLKSFDDDAPFFFSQKGNEDISYAKIITAP